MENETWCEKMEAECRENLSHYGEKLFSLPYSPLIVNDNIDRLESVMKQHPQAKCDLKHTFTPGLYTRRIFMKAGTLIISKIHKTEHPFFILKGVALVRINDDEWHKLEAPHDGITFPGTRRVLYILEDCIWVTSHVLVKEGETLEEIENRIIEKHEIPIVLRCKYKRGQKIGHLIFLYKIKDEGGKQKAVFLCECGKEFVTRIDSAKEGSVKSCGCKTSELLSKAGTKHPPIEYVIDGVKKIPSLTKEHIYRFWSKVAITANDNLCWNWQATGERYGKFNIGKGLYNANRVAYFLHYNVDPRELLVMHSCDNPKCCNPKHLSLGATNDNSKDMVNKGRSNKGETVNTAKLTETEVIEIRKLHDDGVDKIKIYSMFKVAKTTIDCIIDRKTWKHL